MSRIAYLLLSAHTALIVFPALIRQALRELAEVLGYDPYGR